MMKKKYLEPAYGLVQLQSHGRLLLVSGSGDATITSDIIHYDGVGGSGGSFGSDEEVASPLLDLIDL